MNEEINMCGFVRKTISMCDKGWNEVGEKFVWFCENNVFQLCVIKVEVNEERSLCGFVTKTFLTMWQKIKWARTWIYLILWKKHFSIYDGGWSERKGFKNVQVLKLQLKRFDNYGNFVLETWTQLESFVSLLLEPWKGLEGFDNFENSKK